MCVRVFPAQIDRCDLPIRFGVQLDLIQRSDGVSRADLPGIHIIITEIVIGDGPVLETHQPIAHHDLRVEIHLYLGIQRDGLQGAGEIVNEQPFRLAHIIHIGIEAIPIIGELFHECIVVIVHAEADGGHGHAFLHVTANFGEDHLGFRVADIGDTVRAQDDAVDAVRLIGAQSHLVAEANPGFGVGRAFGAQAVDRGENGIFVRTRCRVKHDAGF